MILGNLIRIDILATVANKSSKSNFLFQATLHDITLISNNVEIGDIDNIIAMQRITVVNSLRISSTHQKLQVTRNRLLALATVVALGTDFLSTGVNLTSANTANRALRSLGQNLVNPTIIPLDQLRSAGLCIFIIREQILDILNAMSQSILMLVGIQFDGALQGHTRSLSHLQNFLLVSVGQNVHRLSSATVKHISIHIVISSFRMFHFFLVIHVFVIHVVFLSIFESLTNQSIDNILLLFGKGVKHILYSLFLFRNFLLRLFLLRLFLLHFGFSHRFIVLLFIIFNRFAIGFASSMRKLRAFIITFFTMPEHNVFASINDSAVVRVFSMANNRIDIRTRISSCKD